MHWTMFTQSNEYAPFEAQVCNMVIPFFLSIARLLDPMPMSLIISLLEVLLLVIPEYNYG